MARQDVTISTGVDDLVRLVKERGRVELREAAIELGLSQGVIEEWAKVLEKEGVVRIEYQLTKVFLTTPGPEKTEAQRKAKEISDMQVTLARELETQLKRLERVGKELEEMRNEFVGVSKIFEEKLANVRQRVRELDALEKQYLELCYRVSCANEKLLSDAEALKKQIEESERKLESIRKMKEEFETQKSERK